MDDLVASCVDMNVSWIGWWERFLRVIDWFLSWNEAIWLKYSRLDGISNFLDGSLLARIARFLLLKETVGFTLQWIVHHSFLITLNF